MPKRQRITESKLDIVLYNISIRKPFYLFFAFLAATDFKRVPVYLEIRYRRGDYIMIHPYLVKEESFPYITDIGLLATEIVYQTGVIKIYLIHLPQSTYSARIIPKLGDKSGLLYIKTIIGHTVPAHVECCGNTADIRLKGYTLGDNSQQLFQFPPGGNIHTGVLRYIRLKGKVHNLLNMFILIFPGKRIIPLFEIIREKLKRMEPLRNLHLTLQYIIQRIYRELYVMKKRQVLPKRQPLHVIHDCPATQIGNLFIDIKYR